MLDIYIANPLKKILENQQCKGLPQSPGVYFFWGANAQLLYVGKAKNLKRRILSYRNCSLAKLPRKVRCLVVLTKNITWNAANDETEALLKENSYLRTERPPFNRLNVRPEGYPYLCFIKNGPLNYRLLKCFGTPLEPNAMLVLGAFRSRGLVQASLEAWARLFSILNSSGERPYLSFCFKLQRVPYGVVLNFSIPEEGSWMPLMVAFLCGESDELLRQLCVRLLARELDPFSRSLIGSDLQTLKTLFEKALGGLHRLSVGTGKTYVPHDELDDRIVLSKSKLSLRKDCKDEAL